MRCRLFDRWLFVIGTALALVFLSEKNLWAAFERCNALDPCDLFEDLLIVDYWNRKIAERFPITYNNLLQGGYFAMPSARMGCEGEIGIGYAHVPPYRNWNVRCQFTSFLELSGNYRIFHGVEDHALTRFGFGDFSDKGANFKIALWHPEDSAYTIPGFAIGMEDFMGTRAFKSYYAVLTQIFPHYNLEASLGWGSQRIRGFFGALAWYPFYTSSYTLLAPLSVVAEYDATPYRSCHIEKHPKGRTKKSPINFGFKWRLWNNWDLSMSYIRGDAIAFSAATLYNLGTTTGVLPKKDNPLPYRAPINTEPIGMLRTEEVLMTDMLFAFRRQRFSVQKIAIGYESEEARESRGCINKVLRLHILNEVYRTEGAVKERLDALIAALTPADIDKVIIVIEAEGFPLQEYHYSMPFVHYYADKQMGAYELGLLTPMKDYQSFCESEYKTLFSNYRKRFTFALFPKTETLFGSARGKFKYALGLTAAFNGYLWKDIFWSVNLGWLPISKLYNLSDVDKINPSQLINVRTDIIRYYQNKGITLDEAYLQKNWNLGKGWFCRASIGYFEMAYGGAAGQLLYYPVSSLWAIGFEGAVVKKRHYSGVTFSHTIRKLEGCKPTYRHFLGSQYFFDLYLHMNELNVDLKMQTGKFLANDWGARWELSRYFSSGLEITLWYTVTNGHDKVNGKIYFDKGISFSMPIDMFCMRSARERWGYSLSAWLRDVGASALTGRDLYDSIRGQRTDK